MSEALQPLNIIYRIFAQARIFASTKDIAKNLYKSGCRHVAFGIESMSDKMLGILGKASTVEENKRALDYARLAGLKTRIYLMVGFPGETEETIEKSLRTVMSCDFDEFIVYAFIPYPGTPVWYEPKKWGIRNIDRDFSKYVQVGRDRSTCFAIETDEFTPTDVEKWRSYMIMELEKKFSWAGESKDNK